MSNIAQSVRENRKFRDHWLPYIGRMIIIGFAFVFAFFPIVWIASASFNETGSLNTQRVIPSQVGLENYNELLASDIHPFATWMWNSVWISSVTAILAVLISAMGAYAFSRFRFRGRRGMMLTIFLVQVFPNSLSIVATFLLVQAIGTRVEWLGLNQHAGLIAVYLGAALGINTWLMKGFFDSIPRDVDEAARIDGASDWFIFWRIILPLVRPILAVVGILTFIGTYGDVIISLTLIKETDQQTLAIGLNNFIADTYDRNWGIFSAGALIGAIPIVVLILNSQRFFVGGLTSGAVKG